MDVSFKNYKFLKKYIHERTLRLVYYNCMEEWVIFNQKRFAIRKLKLFHGLSPSIMKNIFHLNTNVSYNLSSHKELCCRNPKPVKHGTETTSSSAPTLYGF